MIKATSSVKLYQPKIRQLTDNAVRALELTAEALHTEVVQAQVMPRDTGAMQGEKTFIKAGESITATYKDGSTATNTITKAQNGRVSIITASPQARRLYFHPEYDFQKDENPNAKGLWFEDWMEGGDHEDFVPKTFASFFKELSKL